MTPTAKQQAPRCSECANLLEHHEGGNRHSVGLYRRVSCCAGHFDHASGYDEEIYKINQCRDFRKRKDDRAH